MPRLCQVDLTTLMGWWNNLTVNLVSELLQWTYMYVPLPRNFAPTQTIFLLSNLIFLLKSFKNINLTILLLLVCLSMSVYLLFFSYEMVYLVLIKQNDNNKQNSDIIINHIYILLYCIVLTVSISLVYISVFHLLLDQRGFNCKYLAFTL